MANICFNTITVMTRSQEKAQEIFSVFKKLEGNPNNSWNWIEENFKFKVTSENVMKCIGTARVELVSLQINKDHSVQVVMESPWSEPRGLIGLMYREWVLPINLEYCEISEDVGGFYDVKANGLITELETNYLNFVYLAQGLDGVFEELNSTDFSSDFEKEKKIDSITRLNEQDKRTLKNNL